MRLKHLAIGAAVAGLVGSAAIPVPAVAQDSIYVPLLTYRTGPFAGSGIPIANGMKDYLEMLNERDGGIGGVKLVIEECETGYDTKKGVECYEAVKGKKPVVMNPWSTGITLQLIPKASVDKIPILSMAYGLSAAAVGKDFPWVFNPPLTYWDALGQGAFAAKLRVQYLRDVGAAISPFSAFLLIQGIETLSLRMERHTSNAQVLAEWLQSRDEVEKVYYPGLETHPYYDVARRTMRGFAGLVTFNVRGADWKQTAKVIDSVKIPRIGPSLGGVESLIEQPLVMSYFDYSPEDRKRFGIDDNMIRMSCGIENTQDLIDDLAQALNQI